ncbi:MAG: phosphoglucosamine mutase [Candidatus Sumerlaeia bacterium]
MSQLIVSVAGVRGVVGDSLTPPAILPSLAAFGEIMRGKTVVVGGDGRPSFEPLHHLVLGVLTASGCRVRDAGIVPTPTVGLLVRELRAAGGVMITASHNPAPWNGLKFFNRHGRFFDTGENAALAALRDRGDWTFADWKHAGSIQPVRDPLEAHIAWVLAFVKQAGGKARRRRLKVVVDAVNGAASVIGPALIRRMGCDVTAIHTDQGRPFPRPAEPLPQNLGRLSARVKAEKADVGFGLDPDGDRLAVVDETGRPLGEERTLVLAAHWYLTNFGRTALVANLSTTRALDDVAAAFGVPLHRTPIGEINVVKKMIAVRSRLGGEGNGGAIVPAVHPGRDASTAMAIFISLLRQTGKPLSAVNALYPDYAMVKDKVRIEGLRPEQIYERLLAAFPDRAGVDTGDGLKILFSDAWLHVRPSGTEPILRLFAEAPAPSAARNLIAAAKQCL